MMLWMNKPYYSLDTYLKNTFGEKIYKIAIDGGFTCPNRDGSIDTRGCIFCSSGGSGDFAATANQPVSLQIKEGISLFREKKIGQRFIAYFQAYTNTYASTETLRSLYEKALQDDQIIGLSIATRPDCFSADIYALFSDLKRRYPEKFIWIELGLQTKHEKSALFIRRGYSLSVFESCMEKLKELGIPCIIHCILGLPGETKEDMLETVRYVNLLSPFGIKLQLLHVLKNTDLADLYEKGTFSVLTLDSYLDILTDSLELLSPEIIIHRVTGDGPKELLIAPTWRLNKRNVLNSLHKKMQLQKSYQGKST